MSIRKHWRLGAVALGCLVLGAGASAIATAGASPSSAKSPRPVRPGARRLLRRAVHGDFVLATPSGFATVTFDRGIVRSLNGRQLTVADGTRTRTYRTVVLTIPPSARVRDDGRLTTLSAVKPGQRATVIQGPKRTLVIARTVPAPYRASP